MVDKVLFNPDLPPVFDEYPLISEFGVDSTFVQKTTTNHVPIICIPVVMVAEEKLSITVNYLSPPTENVGLYKGFKQMSDLLSSYQPFKDTSCGQQIVSSTINTTKQCNLDKDVDLQEEEVEISAKERDSLVEKVYSKRLKSESRLLPCGLSFFVVFVFDPRGLCDYMN